MSVFRVKLNSTDQGRLDVHPTSGAQMSPSLQRTMHTAGPNRIYRKLFDGQTFTDCNYWKRYAFPQVPLEQAFIEVVTDDGSVFSDVASENTFPRVYDLAPAAGSVFTDNVINVIGDNGGPALFTQIVNQAAVALKFRLNGLATAVVDLPASATQIFDEGDLAITKIEFSNATGSPGDVQVTVSVKSVCNS
jgi:hypothetical protein